jgi:hypothetical protein
MDFGSVRGRASSCKYGSQCCFCLQGGRLSQARNILGLVFDLEDVTYVVYPKRRLNFTELLSVISQQTERFTATLNLKVKLSP